jgi:hypothetical protein
MFHASMVDKIVENRWMTSAKAGAFCGANRGAKPAKIRVCFGG